MSAPVVFVDTETTGLDPERHQIWELAIIMGEGDEYAWQLPVDLSRADPNGLRVGRFYERRAKIGKTSNVATLHRVQWPRPGTIEPKWDAVGLPVAATAATVARLLDGNHVVGAVPSFDAAFLGPWLRAHGHAATWHYHLVDVEALAAGQLQAEPPWNSQDLSRGVGVDPKGFDRHTALGDARWAKAIYEAVIGATA